MLTFGLRSVSVNVCVAFCICSFTRIYGAEQTVLNKMEQLVAGAPEESSELYAGIVQYVVMCSISKHAVVGGNIVETAAEVIVAAEQHSLHGKGQVRCLAAGSDG